MSKLTVVAYTLSLLVQVALILVLVAGTSPSTLSQLTLFDMNVEDLKISGELTSSEFLRGLQSISGTDLTGGDVRAQALGLARSYAVYIYTVCSQSFSGSTTCSDFEVGWWFNPHKTLRLGDRGLSVDLPGSYNSAIDFYESASYFLGIGIILALVATILTFVFGVLARRFPKLRLVPGFMSLLAAVLLAAEAPLAFRVARRMKSALTSGLDLGIRASIGAMVYFLFGLMAVALVTVIIHFVAMRRAKHAYSKARPRYPRFDGPPEDPGEGKSSSYDSKRSLKQMLSWKNHKYEKIGDERNQQRPISMEPLRPRDQASLLEPDSNERDN